MLVGFRSGYRSVQIKARTLSEPVTVCKLSHDSVVSEVHRWGCPAACPGRAAARPYPTNQDTTNDPATRHPAIPGSQETFPIEGRSSPFVSSNVPRATQRSRYRQLVEDLLHDGLAGLLFRFSLVSDGHAVTQDVHGDALDVLRCDIAPRAQECMRFRRQRQRDGCTG